MPPPPYNPPIPAGLRPWSGPVSPEDTIKLRAWATRIDQDPATYPMHSMASAEFGDRIAVARVEWHTWTYRAGKLVQGVFRGVTLYEPIP